jgi:cytochrome c551/c552
MRFVPVSGGLILLAAAVLGKAANVIPPSVESQQALVNKYCVACHNDKLKSGGFSWAKIDLAHPDRDADETEKVIRKVRAGMMPPAGLPRPDNATAQEFASVLETAIDKAAALHPSVGAPDLHRLNRTEYRNSIRDLLGIDVDAVSLLPPDDLSHGFDNMSDVLTVTPALMQAYIRAAGKISRAAVGDAQAAPATTSYNVPKVVSQMRHVDGAPFGTRGGISVVHNFPTDGEYSFKLMLYYYYTEELFGSALPDPLKSQQIEISVDGVRVALFTIDPKVPETQSNFVTPPIKLKAGPRTVSAAFLSKLDGPVPDAYRLDEQVMVDVSIGLQPGMSALPHLHTMAITGPLSSTGVSETPSRSKIFTCRPASESQEAPCARKIVSVIARQAYRRPVTNSDLEPLLKDYEFGRKEGSFETGIRMAVQAILANPQFVFRFERAPANLKPGANYRISDLELASRLSYFLWSSAPDDQLITLASENKLRRPEVLDGQVRRMLADQKAEALADNFAAKWLHLQYLKETEPDGGMFPDFTQNLALSMQHETELLFDSMVREDRNLVDLLTAKYTYVDEVLAKHYGIPNILGSRFRRVEITDPNRFGLLGQGSILTLTSQANRTSPVQRGKYVMEVLLGAPPPPPPPDVPALKENVNNTKPLSVRERMEEHRASPACAGCHKLMDPIGLALENFDPVGIWRDNDSGFPVDPSGQMFDGTKLDGPISLRQAILNRSGSFIGNFTENLLAYGVGRVLDYHDMPTVRSIERQASSNDNRFSAFILGVVESSPFQMRRAEEAAPGTGIGDVHTVVKSRPEVSAGATVAAR